MKLIDNWKDAWRWHSTRALAALSLLPFVWMELPADLKAKVPPEWLPWIISVVAIGGFAGRIVKQGPRE